MFTLLRQRRLRWLGHVHRMEDGRITKNTHYGQLATDNRDTGRPQLRFRYVVKRDMKALKVNTEHWEELATDRSSWRSTPTVRLQAGEDQLKSAAEEKWTRRKELCYSHRTETIHKCDLTDKDCHSRICLFSHIQCCSSRTDS